jgi:hypothetical protein
MLMPALPELGVLPAGLSGAAKPKTASSAPSRASGRLVEIDPLQYRAWDSVLSFCPNSSFFQTTAWARVLHDSYGHRPLYFCEFSGDKLEELLPVMEVSSLLTGRRGISLPFTDFCFPLNVSSGNHAGLYEQALQRGQSRGWCYLQCRGSNYGWLSAKPALAFHAHCVSLREKEKDLFTNLDSAVRRAVRKAQRAGLQLDFSTSRDSVRAFFVLHCETRRRHGLPPQPFRFFENIHRHVLAQEHGRVVTVRREGRPIAAAVFFHHGRQAIYKFGASDYAFQQMRPSNLLIWAAIQRYAAENFETLHLGRTSLANQGLRRFKLGFGANEERLDYYKFDFFKRTFVSDTDRSESRLNSIFGAFPPALLRLIGKLIYPHLS